MERRRSSAAVIWQRRTEAEGPQSKRYVSFVSTNADWDQDAESPGSHETDDSTQRRPSQFGRRPSYFVNSSSEPKTTSGRRPSILHNDLTTKQSLAARRPSNIRIKKLSEDEPPLFDIHNSSPTDSVFTRRRPSVFDKGLAPDRLTYSKRRPSMFTPISAIPESTENESSLFQAKSQRPKMHRRSASGDTEASGDDVPLQPMPKNSVKPENQPYPEDISPTAQFEDPFSRKISEPKPSLSSTGRKPSFFHVPSYVNKSWQDETKAWREEKLSTGNAEPQDPKQPDPKQADPNKRHSGSWRNSYVPEAPAPSSKKQNRLSSTLFGGFSFKQNDENTESRGRRHSSENIAPIMGKQQNFPERSDSLQYREQKDVPTFIKPLSDQYFVSRRTGMDAVSKPWLNTKDPRRKWANLFPLLGLFVGLCIAFLLVWDGLGTVETHDYCLILEDNFDGTELNTAVWTKEAQVDGYGNGQFEETTVTDENVFLKDGSLWIKPTLQNATLVETTGSHINLTENGICTGTTFAECFTSTNTTNGTIVNPVKSGRINTRKAAAIQYGRIEVVAKLPKGDWLWPAIWMMPVKDTYGLWPQSGEIDIAESRGNNHSYGLGGNNIISSSLHWGPDQTNDAWWRTYKKRAALHTTYSDKFHTFGLEWSERYLYTYIDSRLAQVLYIKFNKPMWQSGDFPLADSNGTAYVNTWASTGRDSTPFDQPFYLILNVAVGGDNGWFKDGQNGKPWVDKSPNEKLEFWNARDQWHPTWDGGGQLEVQSVKMWQQKGYRGC